MGLEIVQNLCLGENRPVGSDEHVVVGINLGERPKITVLESRVEFFAMYAAHFLFR